MNTENTEIYACEEGGIVDREWACPEDAVTLRDQEVLDQSITFASYGPELSVTDDDSVITYEVAVQNGKSVILASESESKGRILLFSSQLIFDNRGQITDYTGGGNDVDNRQIIKDSITWLAQPRSVKLIYQVDSETVEGNEVTVKMKENHQVQFIPFSADGAILDLGEQINVSLLINDLASEFSEYYTAYYVANITF